MSLETIEPPPVELPFAENDKYIFCFVRDVVLELVLERKADQGTDALTC